MTRRKRVPEKLLCPVPEHGPFIVDILFCGLRHVETLSVHRWEFPSWQDVLDVVEQERDGGCLGYPSPDSRFEYVITASVGEQLVAEYRFDRDLATGNLPEIWKMILPGLPKTDPVRRFAEYKHRKLTGEALILEPSKAALLNRSRTRLEAARGHLRCYVTASPGWSAPSHLPPFHAIRLHPLDLADLDAERDEEHWRLAVARHPDADASVWKAQLARMPTPRLRSEVEELLARHAPRS